MNNWPPLTANGISLCTSSTALARFTETQLHKHSTSELKNRLDTEGYLLLRGFFEPNRVLDIRSAVLKSTPDFSTLTTFQKMASFKSIKNSGDLPLVKNLIHDSPLQDLFTKILGGPSQAFDFIWSRVVGPGQCETPHCDTVYMNRGTNNLYTSWIPLGDVPLRQGPLMILEHSHELDKLNWYRSLDIDKNRIRRRIVYKHGRFFSGFHFSKNPKEIQREFNLRWLTHDFQAGDILIFSVHHLHGTLDNRTDSLRVVLDARYQLSNEPFDERYMGDDPIGHTPSGLGVLTRIKNRWDQFAGHLSSL